MEAMVRPVTMPGRDSAARNDRTSAESTSRWRAVFTALADGRTAALDELYDLAAKDVYRLALWRTGSVEDAEDVVHDVFVRLAERHRQLASVRHPRRWVLTIAHRRAVDLVRQRARRREDPIDDVPYLVAPAVDPDRAVEAGRLSRIIHRLPEKQRVAVLLRDYVGCSYAEAGRITGVPTFTAASRHRLAVARLRRELGGPHDI
jgi:RNA polymerase sigma factor (sigma-70 family)